MSPSICPHLRNIHNLDDVMDNPNHVFVHGNIINKELVRYLVIEHGINHFVNFAAEQHVDHSILNPKIFIETNIQGTTLALLNVVKETNIEKYLQISTEEVYGSLGAEGYFTEETPLAPNSPYSASTAGAYLLIQSYYETYGININITRYLNNYGPYHFPEKLIPLIITNGMIGKYLLIYGDSLNIRDWLHVHDHCQAIDLGLLEGCK